MTTLLSIDPGMSTGVSVGVFSEQEPYRLSEVYQIEGGVQGFIPFLKDLELPENTVVIAEKFTARGSANGFSYRTEALEPLRVEGAMLALGLEPVWCSPAQQYFAGGKGGEAKKKSHAWLKSHELYISPKSVGCKDANDARSATLHAISYLRRIQHLPTIQHYFPRKEE